MVLNTHTLTDLADKITYQKILSHKEILQRKEESWQLKVL